MIRRITLDGREIVYELTYKKVKNINLRIYPDGKIKLSANRSVSLEVIEGFIRSRSPFILGALDKFRAQEGNAPALNSFQNDDSVRIFDEVLTLKVLESNKNRAERRGGELWLFVRYENDRDLREKTLDAYLKKELLARIDAALPEIYARFSAFDFDMPEVKIRKMKTRWGSCNCAKKTVTLALALVGHPLDCLYFVIAHELCHLVHPNHSKAFYITLTSVMPDWKEHKRILNGK